MRGAILGVACMIVAVLASTQVMTIIRVPDNPGSEPYSAVFDPPRSAIEVLANAGDGQAFAALALDPALNSTRGFRGDQEETAYRWQRPLAGYLTWLGSGGERTRFAPALWILTMVSIGTLVWAVAAHCREQGVSTLVAIAALAQPGVIAVGFWLGPEALGTALAISGLIAWNRQRTALATLLFVSSGLCRETLLLIPMMIGIEALVRHQWERRSYWLSVAPAVLAAWYVVIRARLGSWPWAAGSGRLSAPFVGVAKRAPAWTLLDWCAVVGLVVVVSMAWRATPRLRFQLGGHVVMAATMGPLVWGRWLDFGRPLVPLYALSLAGTGLAIRAIRSGSGDVEHSLQRHTRPLSGLSVNRNLVDDSPRH
jgi:hypothetical protein